MNIYLDKLVNVRAVPKIKPDTHAWAGSFTSDERKPRSVYYNLVCQT